VGWVSIIEPEVVTKALDVPAEWKLVAHLCVERHGWEQRIDMEPLIFRR